MGKRAQAAPSCNMLVCFVRGIRILAFIRALHGLKEAHVLIGTTAARGSSAPLLQYTVLRGQKTHAAVSRYSVAGGQTAHAAVTRYFVADVAVGRLAPLPLSG